MRTIIFLFLGFIAEGVNPDFKIFLEEWHYIAVALGVAAVIGDVIATIKNLVKIYEF